MARGALRYRLVAPSRVDEVLTQFRWSFLDAAIDRVVRAWMP